MRHTERPLLTPPRGLRVALALAISTAMLSGCWLEDDDEAVTPKTTATADVTQDPAAATSLVQTEAAKTDASSETTEPIDASSQLATDDTSETS